ncbi:NAD(P)/FAD-dependent oxidoreductase [Mesonia sp. K7]|uniref:phytoene desaturase family protein n=1 Tax=Mesonia sp. K7 TaxID=2218606 RepID=UPI000DA9AD6D|nr:phytoene desaturase family protein [Mesonia sp. K7]PZD77870.1 phytoene desaturase [Mesonia sp. K7]
MNKKVIIIGAGFSSLSAACYLAKYGYEVKVIEKNNHAGGRAQQLIKEGFKFDMGPTWYWMPDVFEKFFADFNKSPKDYYQLEKLNPAYQVYFGENDSITIGDSLEKIKLTFESIEKGSGKILEDFIAKAEKNYDISINKLVLKPGISPLELITLETLTNLNLFFTDISTAIRKKFNNPKLIQILEFPVLFLGAKPSKTPAFYSFMNFADFGLGTWYVKGGMFEVAQGLHQLAQELGVKFYFNEKVEQIITENKKAIGINTQTQIHKADIILSGADYHYTETLLPQKFRQYSEGYWNKRTFAPSALLFYVGFDKKLRNVNHHTLFFDTDFQNHIETIYDDKKWPKEPLFYASFPSVTDSSVAPEGNEAGVFLIPLAIDIEDNEEIRNRYFDEIVSRLERITQQNIKKHILFKESYCLKDFKKDYNSYKGNAYGLANTLLQTAFLRPKLKSKKLRNLYFTGQLTVPGPGVPPALISGKLVADLITKNHVA